MTQKQHPRVARFQRLHAILTGVAHPALPAQFRASDHLRADIGLPKAHQTDLAIGPLGTFPIDPIRR